MSAGRWRPIGLALALCCAGSIEAAGARGETLLLAQGDRESLPVSLSIRIGARSVSDVWDAVFVSLNEFFDRNGDGRLDRAEAARLPSPFSLRQTLWGQFALDFEIGRQGPELKDGESLSSDDLAAHYRKHGVGDAIVATGRVEATKFLNESLIALLDKDRSGTVDASEWGNAEKVLAPLDFNDDELVGPGEIDRRVPSYPGTSGTVLVKPQTTPKLRGAEPATFFLPAGAKLDAIQPPAARRALGLGLLEESFAGPKPSWDEESRHEGRAAALFEIEGLEMEVWSERGTLSARARELAAAAQTWFERLDANRDGTIGPDEVDGTQRAAYERCLVVADRDDDRRLKREEHIAWLELQLRVAEAQMLVTVIDFGRSWFVMLDGNRDGGLSVSELRTAGARLAKSELVAETDGKLSRTRPVKQPPRVLTVTVSRGHPRTVLHDRWSAGPTWFTAMDRNGDGYVSRREWLLETEAFERYDADRDGLIDSREAGPDNRPLPDPR